jgi:hypothetical protein
MDKEENSRSHGWTIGISVALALYLLVPFIYAIPLLLVRSTGLVREENIIRAGNTLMYPVIKLDEKCPPYHVLMQYEADLLKRLWP